MEVVNKLWAIPAPYFQNFDSGNLPNCWIQDGNDNFDWTVDAGGTPSSNTGPSDDITGEDIIYI